MTEEAKSAVKRSMSTLIHDRAVNLLKQLGVEPTVDNLRTAGHILIHENQIGREEAMRGSKKS